jgi:hypothetical protein
MSSPACGEYRCVTFQIGTVHFMVLSQMHLGSRLRACIKNYILLIYDSKQPPEKLQSITSLTRHYLLDLRNLAPQSESLVKYHQTSVYRYYIILSSAPNSDVHVLTLSGISLH